VTETRGWLLAEDALARGQVEDALTAFEAVGRQGGLRAEAALLRKGQLELWTKAEPERALRTLAEAARRYPQGDLARENALSRLEAVMALERWAEVRREAGEFVARFPSSERQGEVLFIGAIGAWRAGDLESACAALSKFEVGKLPKAHRTNHAQLSKLCQEISP
jgi:outer membrane protein assembly factor BamD (BamD/ComL family)